MLKYLSQNLRILWQLLLPANTIADRLNREHAADIQTRGSETGVYIIFNRNIGKIISKMAMDLTPYPRLVQPANLGANVFCQYRCIINHGAQAPRLTARRTKSTQRLPNSIHLTFNF